MPPPITTVRPRVTCLFLLAALAKDLDNVNSLKRELEDQKKANEELLNQLKLANQRERDRKNSDSRQKTLLEDLAKAKDANKNLKEEHAAEVKALKDEVAKLKKQLADEKRRASNADSNASEIKDLKDEMGKVLVWFTRARARRAETQGAAFMCTCHHAW